MNGEVNFLKTNIRYRIICIADEYYLLDTEKFFWLIFLPITLWLTPHKVYKIDADIVKELEVPTSYRSDSKRTVWLGAGGAVVLTPFLQTLLDRSIGLNVVVNVLLLIIIIAIFVSLKLYIRNSLGRKLFRTVDIHRLETKVIRIWPRYFAQYINPFIFGLFIVFFLTLGINLFIVTSNFIPLFGFLIMLSLLLVSNMFFIDPRFGKRNLYCVSIVK